MNRLPMSVSVYFGKKVTNVIKKFHLNIIIYISKSKFWMIKSR